jgi:YesN/AraC family two-component response regulator
MTGMEAPYRVLLVDDVAEIRKLLRLTLELDGRFEVVGEAEDGAAAVALASSRHPDVVILDVSMPVMDGLEAIPQITRLSPATKIIVLSALEDATSRQALSLGAHAYLVKEGAVHEDVVPKILTLCA